MTNETEAPDLKPCPFCKGGKTIIEPCGQTWMGQQYSEPQFYKLTHNGKLPEGDGFETCHIQFRARTPHDIVYMWNDTRADLSDAKDKRMSDNLVEKARHNVLADMPHYASVELIEAMADRIEELEAQNRELHMQVIASDGQAQMAYEEQERLEAAPKLECWMNVYSNGWREYFPDESSADNFAHNNRIRCVRMVETKRPRQ